MFMKKELVLSAIVLAIVIFAFGQTATFAAEPKALVNCDANTCTLNSLFDTVHRVIKVVLLIIPWVAMAIIAVAGFKILIDPNNPDTKNKSKVIITATIVGLVIIYTSWAVVDLFLKGMGYQGESWFKF